MNLFRERGTRRRVTKLLAQIRPGVAAMPIHGGLRLEQELGLDSLAMAALAVRLHEELEVDLMALAERRREIQTIDDLVKVVEELANGA